MSDLYFQDIWFDSSKLSLKEKQKIILYAKELIDKGFGSFLIDKLENMKFQRQSSDLTFDEIIKMLNEKCHFVIIHRRGYISWKETNEYFTHKRWCLELGFSTEDTSPINFLWMYINEDKIGDFILKFKLKIKEN